MKIQLMLIILLQCCILSSCSSSMGRVIQQQGFGGIMTMIGMGGEGFKQISKSKTKFQKYKIRNMPKPLNL